MFSFFRIDHIKKIDFFNLWRSLSGRNITFIAFGSEKGFALRRTLFGAVLAGFMLAAAPDAGAQTPGGVSTANITPIAWFTPENYNNGRWTNRVTTSGTVGHFTQPGTWGTKTPPATTTGANFHSAVMFRPTSWAVSPHRMMSDNMIGITSNEAFTIILVYKCTQLPAWDHGNILHYGSGSQYNAEYNVTYNTPNSNTLYTGWPATRRTLGGVPAGITHILTIDNSNTDNTTGIRWYLSGLQMGVTESSNGSANSASGNDYKIVIGGSHWDLTTDCDRSFTGDVQEVIILKRNRNSYPFLVNVGTAQAEFNKIQSYLSIKYGTTLSTNYVNSAGTVVWNTTTNNGYNNNIFGIARDDNSGLYQKQSVSMNEATLTAFIGNALANLNSNNTGVFNSDRIYLLFGSNNQTGSLLYQWCEDTQFANGKLQNIFFIERQKRMYKAQVTGPQDTITTGLKIAASLKAKYVLVSNDQTFTPASTVFYPVNTDGTVTGVKVANGDYIGFVSGADNTAGGNLIAVDDFKSTGPMQSIRVNVALNDTLPCSRPFVEIPTALNPVTQGVAVVASDGFIEFTPAPNSINTTVNIDYRVSCSCASGATAKLSVQVRDRNHPINVVPQDVECFEEMPGTSQFKARRKFIAKSDTYVSEANPGGYLQQFHMPLVGDINGDGKPEIICPSVTAVGSLSTSMYAIYIFDGQTGNKLYRFVLNSLGAGYGDFQLGSLPYHQSPSYMAMADVDNDGIGEIIVCESTGSGKVYALKPVLDIDKKITGMVKLWDGEYGHKAPLSGNYTIYGQPIPNIVDINGDGTPELVVHNKIYNARTGKLLMAWNGTAASATASSLAGSTGLDTYNPGTGDVSNVSRNQTMSNTVKSRAMIGRRPGGGTGDALNYCEPYVAVPAIVDIDGDGKMEIVTGNRIHKFNLTYLGKAGENGSHTNNTYTTEDGPASVSNVPFGGSTNVTFYFNDGFTRVADLDGDGHLEAVVFQNASGQGLDLNILVYIWDLQTKTLKAVSSFYSNGDHGTFGIPFVGDINDRLDGRDVVGAFTKKLPEVCLIAGKISLNRSTGDLGGRTGMGWHVQSNNGTSRTDQNMLIAMTYDGGIANVYDRLKVSWVLEHQDYSNNTGITMFDFNNDNAFDLCYRDEETLRVISPKLGATDYIRFDASSPAILFKENVYSETGYEAPVIADINLDGSADIAVAGFSVGGYYANCYVFERDPAYSKWAPCPPVWNQALYNPLHINDDLTVPARPISMLTEFTKRVGVSTEVFRPYNGAWIQQPIVKEGGSYNPIVRNPDADITNMKVEIQSSTATKVTLTIVNRGSATISAASPITFYDGGTSGHIDSIGQGATMKQKFEVGADIFPGEIWTLDYTLTNFDYAGHLIWARIMDGGGTAFFPASGFNDCVLRNNTASGSSCPNLIYTISADPDTILCASGGNVTLWAVPNNPANLAFRRTFQWYRNDIAINNATDSSYVASLPGNYKCFVTEDICRIYTPIKHLTVSEMNAFDDNMQVLSGAQTPLFVTRNDVIPLSCDLALDVTKGPYHGTAVPSGDTIFYHHPAAGFTGLDSFFYKLAPGADSAWVHVLVMNRPDNIIEANCTGNPPATQWSIGKTWTSTYNLADSRRSWYVGNLDNDSLPEIVCHSLDGYVKGTSSVSLNAYEIYKKIVVFPGNDRDNPLVIDLDPLNNNANMRYGHYQMIAPMGLVKVGGQGLIVVAGNTTTTGANANSGFLHAYRYPGGTLAWTTSESAIWGQDIRNEAPSVAFADFNNDGIPEVYSGNKIFSAAPSGGGQLLCKGTNADYQGWSCYNDYSATPVGGVFSVAADIDGDGKPELITGNRAWKVTESGGAWSMSDWKTANLSVLPRLNGSIQVKNDGHVSIADFNKDGHPDVLVSLIQYEANTGTSFYDMILYGWDVYNNKILFHKYFRNNASGKACLSIPFIGDIDGDGELEIVALYDVKLRAFDLPASFGPTTVELSQKWETTVVEDGGRTGITLFDFNQDGTAELVYRGEESLQILNGTSQTTIGTTSVPAPLAQFASFSTTTWEFPIVADVDNDGAAEIVVVGHPGPKAADYTQGYVSIYKSLAQPWAPARGVWNQYAYNAVNVNNDLTIPSVQLNPAIAFPGNNGLLGDNDDVHPYNNFLQQQTLLNKNGNPLWLLPNVFPDPSSSSVELIGDSVCVTVGVVNLGDAAIGPPVYVTLYKESVASGNKFFTDSVNITIQSQDTGYVQVRIPNINLHLQPPFVNIVARVNDKNGVYPHYNECILDDSVTNVLNPAISRYMKKDATLNGVQNNGAYSNPVSILFRDTITYQITAWNANLQAGRTMTVVDTLPAYLAYADYQNASHTSAFVNNATAGSPQRRELKWTITGVPAQATVTITFKATPEQGAVASQPLFASRAYVTVSDTVTVPTANRTYHQGAGISVVTFSAGLGGSIFNATPQAVDFRTSPRSGIIVAPDEGYRFAGWSHDTYTSLRAATIPAHSGVMRYDTLTIYGDVELRAVFEPEKYPVRYHLNGGVNAESNPAVYTVETGVLTLKAPAKADDVFTGWTGSNGDKPQETVTITAGTTGALDFYANFLYSGRENESANNVTNTAPRIWAVGNELHILTQEAGGIVRIFSPAGVLLKLHTILTAGETKIKLPFGIYFVTLNDGTGTKVILE